MFHMSSAASSNGVSYNGWKIQLQLQHQLNKLITCQFNYVLFAMQISSELRSLHEVFKSKDWTQASGTRSQLNLGF